MAGIPQITNPIQGKGYSTTLNNNRQPGGEQFEIIQLTKPQAPRETGEREAGNRSLAPDRKDLIPMTVKTPKDPTMAVETLKTLINSELLATAKANGYTELYGELEELSKSIYLSVDKLVQELLNQEKQTSMFANNKLFDMLRELAGRAIATENDEMGHAIGNFLKAVTFSLNRDEILNAVASNLKFLSGYFSPSQTLSEQLFTLSEAWAASDARGFFELLKGETLNLLQKVSASLLNNEKTQILIPLIIHNLSRYNTNNYMIRDYFSALLVHIPATTRNELTAAFEAYARSLNGEEPADAKEPSAQTADAAKGETSQPNNTTKSEINQVFFDKESVFPALFSEKLSEKGFFPRSMPADGDVSEGLKGFLSGKMSGMDAVRMTLAALTGGDESLISALNADLNKVNSIEGLVNYLNDILKLLPDTAERQSIFEILSETVMKMAERSELPPEKPPVPQTAPDKSALDDLTAFIEKNINHAAIKSLNSFNASNLLQSLINAPGVFTPLSHYIIPLQIGDTRAFGELWVDNDERNAASQAGGGKKNFHLFLTFEIESVGRFETDVYASGEEISLALLYPGGFAREIKSVKERVNRLIADTGFSVKEFKTGVLKEPHNLTQIFPRILERRKGLDVMV
ncbi:MAG: hypothetical protein LBI36_02390 [Oscillospiraceae bacterium]|jgi:hypothetical protein|nr:hypothetical protein [Oscillospiraceae bacterium]